LTPPKRVTYIDRYDLKDKIIPNKHGVILSYNENQATFLPQVWEQLPSFDEFINSLCLKANVSASCLEENAQIFIYEAMKIKE
jgi:hypothetical protein